jgi:LmbE family N-acetylglucosaminyl deacetylase
MSPHRSYNLGGSHRDHRITAGVALDCVYPLARDHLAFPELMPDYEPHKVLEIHLMQWENPQLVVDISDVMDLKLKALACHASQFADFPAVEKRVRERSAELGKATGIAHAETFDRIVMMR